MAKPSPDARPKFAQYSCKAHINIKYNINYIFISVQFRSVVSVFRTPVWVLFGLFKVPFIDFDIHSIRQLTQVNKAKQTERKKKKKKKKKGVSPFLALSVREKKKKKKKKKSFYWRRPRLRLVYCVNVMGSTSGE